MLQRINCGRRGLDLDLLSPSDLLVYDLDMGDRVVDPAAGRSVLGDLNHGRTRRTETMDLVRLFVGHLRAYQSLASLISPGVGIVGRASIYKAEQTLARGGCRGFPPISRLSHAMANTELPELPTFLFHQRRF